MYPRRLDLGFALLVAGFAAGCAGSHCKAQDPDQVLRDYAAAVRRGDADAAWTLLSEETKRTTTFEVFRDQLLRDPKQAKQLAELMERPIGPTQLTAELGSPDADPIELVQLDGRWRMRLESLDPYSQSSPLAALRSFVLALERHRYDVLLRLCPSRDRQGLDEAKLRQAFEGPQRDEVAALSRAIADGLSRGRPQVQGDRATFDLGAGSTVELLLENGAWHIENYRR